MNKKKKNVKKKSTNTSKKTNNSKAPKETTVKKKKRKKTHAFIKILLILFFTCCIIGLFLVGSFFGYIIVKSPEFSPEQLYDKQPSILYDKDGREFARVGSEIRDIISYDQLPEVLVNAVVATEDSRFFQHNGFDFPRFLKASFGQALGNSGAGGASTLTMQISKNKLTDTVSTGTAGIIRKFTDIYLSIFKIEKAYTKQEIIEFYVNSNYLGADANGVEDASKAYFRKSAKDLNLAEAAMIAGLFNAPGYYDPYKNPDGCETRRQMVLYLMERHGYITAEEREIANKMTVDKLIKPKQENKNDEFQGFINTVVEEVQQKTSNDPYLVAMKIYTTMDRDQQSHMEKLMRGELPQYQWVDDVVQGGVAVVSAKDGSITAVGTGRNRGAKTLNYATGIRRQIGSTAKPLYDYSIGIEQLDWSTYQIFVDEPWGYGNGSIPVKNWNLSYSGLITMRQALIDSVNIAAIKAFQSTSNASKVEWASKLGLHPELEGGTIHEAHALGGYNGESPLSLAAAYNTFATGGYYIEPYSFTKIEYLDGNTEPFEYKYTMTKVMSEETAWMITNLLTSVARGTGFVNYYVNGVRYAGKSGTTNLDKETAAAWQLPSKAVDDLWAAGFTDKYTIAIWHGYDNRSSTYYNTFGSGQNYRLFAAAADGVFKEQSNFPMPNGVVAVEVERGLYDATLPSPNTPSDYRQVEYFKKGTEPTKVSDIFATLPSVTNLKATKSSDSKFVTLTWTPIKTPNAINLEYWKDYMAKIYKNAEYGENAAIAKYNEFLARLGTLAYKVYEKDSEGNEKLVEVTDKNSVILTPSDTEVTYSVVVCHGNFLASTSNRVEITVSGLSVKPTTPSTGGSTGGTTDPADPTTPGTGGNTNNTGNEED